MASVTHVENPDGSHSLGVTLGKSFVPFVTVPAERVAQLVAAAAPVKAAAKTKPEEGAS